MLTIKLTAEQKAELEKWWKEISKESKMAIFSEPIVYDGEIKILAFYPHEYQLMKEMFNFFNLARENETTSGVPPE